MKKSIRDTLTSYRTFFSEGRGGSGLKDRGSLLVSYKGRTITFLSGRGGLDNFQKKNSFTAKTAEKIGKQQGREMEQVLSIDQVLCFT